VVTSRIGLREGSYSRYSSGGVVREVRLLGHRKDCMHACMYLFPRKPFSVCKVCKMCCLQKVHANSVYV
jgi:hypothetical protein